MLLITLSSGVQAALTDPLYPEIEAGAIVFDSSQDMIGRVGYFNAAGFAVIYFMKPPPPGEYGRDLIAGFADSEDLLRFYEDSNAPGPFVVGSRVRSQDRLGVIKGVIIGIAKDGTIAVEVGRRGVHAIFGANEALAELQVIRPPLWRRLCAKVFR